MICYKDITFCSYWLDCKNSNTCKRVLTPEIKQSAIKSKLYICRYAEKPDCWVEEDSGIV